MGRKKKKPVKPWCWYCNREFDDDKILVQHQRAKHFKCPFCHKKLYSGPGLTVHCIQVHKEHLDKIPEALPNRNSVDIDIYGMQGIPEEDVREHERLKRGSDDKDAHQKSSDNQAQRANSSKTVVANQQHLGPPQMPQMPQGVTAMSAMHAAMYQHAVSMGAMPPPGFLVPPGMPPPGMPPPGMQLPPPGFMPPPGFPPNHAHLMHPGMPPPPPHLGLPRFQQTIPPRPPLNPAPHMGGFVPPPPPSPPPPPQMDQMPGPSSTSVPPPPPMSGVGHLIGIPPPNYNPSSGRLLPPVAFAQSSHDTTSVERQHRSSPRSYERHSENKNQSTSIQKLESSSSATISKPPQTVTSTESIAANTKMENFIDVPALKARIMHPNGDLSLEEMRIELSKYRTILSSLKELPCTDATTT